MEKQQVWVSAVAVASPGAGCGCSGLGVATATGAIVSHGSSGGDLATGHILDSVKKFINAWHVNYTVSK